ncbi:MAG TPA: hypothetical protein VN628_06300 [Vicinamibacterales bacterium]|nr:hypothetical protein [Vicinamibacterales bacterium]
MKLAVLGGVAAICAATAMVAAQAPATEQQTQTIIGCVAGDGSAQNPWTLADVVIPPPAPANAGRGGAGRGGGGRGAGREGAPAAAPTPPPPPPAPINVRVQGLDLTPWRGYRVQIEGVLSPAGAQRTIQAQMARSVYNYGCVEPKATDK